MRFNSIIYIIFLVLAVISYQLTGFKYRWITLLVFSYIFYLSSDYRFFVFIFYATTVSYLCGLSLSKQTDGKSRKRTVVFSVLMCFAPLAYFKYSRFFAKIVADITGLSSFSPDCLKALILPIGISFFTFQAVSYVIDVYRGKIVAEKHYGYYALYISFFPQLVAGPIERAGNILPQFRREYAINERDATLGLRKILLGMFKKVVIADSLSIFVNSVYNNLAGKPGIMIIFATVFFGIQIYCDFSGYSDIAIGSARLFGIELMENFKTPYGAQSIQEFWRKWHISLSTWFTDYVYIPLGGSREGTLKLVRNIMITFLLSGLWHGADYTFIIWGAYLGAIMSIERLLIGRLDSFFHGLGRISKRFADMTRTFLVWLFVMFGWIFFRANSISDLWYIITNLFRGLNPANISVYLDAANVSGSLFAVCIFLSAAVLIYSALVRHNSSFRFDMNTMEPWKRFAIYWLSGCAIILAVMLRPVSAAADFIYFQF